MWYNMGRMKYHLNPCTGVTHDVSDDSTVGLSDRVEFDCVRCCTTHDRRSRWSLRDVFPRDRVAAMVALYYRSHWKDCGLPTYAPAERDWGQMWRSMLGWLYSNGASREGVLKTWEVFRAQRLEWLKGKKPFWVVHEQLYDQVIPVPVRSLEPSRMHQETGMRIEGYNVREGVLVVQRESIPVDNTWVVDERKFEHSFVEVEGTIHDEETPLYLVAHIPVDAVTPSMVWVVGRDRHTKTLFALRVPAQFRYLDAALRWTLSAEPWDRIEEV